MTSPIEQKSERIVLRISAEQKEAIATMAKDYQVSTANIIREFIDYGLKNRHRPNLSRLEKSQIQALYEAVLILRKIGGRVDESIPAEAKTEALSIVEKYFDVKGLD